MPAEQSVEEHSKMVLLGSAWELLDHTTNDRLTIEFLADGQLKTLPAMHASWTFHSGKPMQVEVTVRHATYIMELASSGQHATQLQPTSAEMFRRKGHLPLAAVVGKLSAGQARYQRKGFCCPFPGLKPEEVSTALADFRRCMDEHGHQAYSMYHASHPWLCKVAKHESILDAVAVVLPSSGIYLYSSHLFARAPGESLHDATGLDWHMDGEQYLRRLHPVDSTHFVTVFLALTRCDKDHGCLCARPRCGGPEVHLELQPGQFSVHGPFTQHTGVRNASAATRYCIALRYVAASVRCLEGRESAMLVRGSDPERHFEPMPEPTRENDPAGLARRREVLRKWGQSARDYTELPAMGPAEEAPSAAEPEASRRGPGAGPQRVTQLWEVVCTRVAVREEPHAGAASVGSLSVGDLVFVGLRRGSWVCIDGRDEGPEPRASRPQQWLLTERLRPTPLRLLRRVW